MTPHRYHRLLAWQIWPLLALYTWLGLTPSPGASLISVSDLALHFTGYLAAGVSAGLAFPDTPGARRGLWLFGYSLAIEIGQYFLPTRSFELWDLAANGAGILLGWALYHYLARPLERRLRPWLLA